MTARRRALLAAPAALMLALALWGLRRPSLYGSEADTFWAARLPVSGLARLVHHVDAVHGLYYLGMHVWLLPGGGATWLRVPSALGMTAAALGVTVLAARLATVRVGVLAGVLFALNPWVDNYAQDGRSYALVCACVVAMLLVLLRAVDAPQRRSRWWAYGVLVTLTGYLHEMTLLLLPALGVTMLLSRLPRATVGRWALAGMAGALPVTPLLWLSHRQSAQVGYLRPPDLSTVRSLVGVLFGMQDGVAWVLLGLAALGAVAGPGSVLAHRGERGITLGRLALPVLVLPAAALLIESRVGTPLYDYRYVLYATTAAAMLAASGIDAVAGAVALGVRRLRPAAGIAAAAAVCLAACVAVAVAEWPDQRYVRTVASRHQDFGGASAFLAAHASPGDAVLFMPRTWRSAALGYPADYRQLDDVAERVSPADAGTFLGVEHAPSDVRAAVLAHPQVWTVGSYPLVGGAHGVPGVARVLRTDFRPRLVGRFAGTAVVLWERTSTPPLG